MPQKEAASSMKRPKETVYKSTDVRNPFLGFHFRRCGRLRRKLEHRCFLTFKHIIQLARSARLETPRHHDAFAGCPC